MMTNTHNIDPALQHYPSSIGQSEHPILTALRERTQSHHLGKMVIVQGQVAMLVWPTKLLNAKEYLGVGVFTGYSSTVIVLALPEDGKTMACGISVTFTDIIHETWQTAGIAHRISLHLQPALLTLDDLITQGEPENHDLVLIDADKPSTPKYFKRCSQPIRSGGAIAIDNTLLGGYVMNEATENDPSSLGILCHFNQNLPHDTRIIPITLPTDDGLTLLLKK